MKTDFSTQTKSVIGWGRGSNNCGKVCRRGQNIFANGHRHTVKQLKLTGLEITADQQSAKNFVWSAEKQGFQPEKVGKVMTANHHDQELWKHYFKLWWNEKFVVGL
jgi:hypothetical protein